MSTRSIGIVALVGALFVFAGGIVAYGNAMGPHAFATAAAILAEAAVVLLVLDRVARLQQGREWAFVRQTAGRCMAAVMVDVVRLWGILWSTAAFDANVDRWPEFSQLADLHLLDLRSNIESLALAAAPDDYEAARRIERRIAWLVHRVEATAMIPRHPGVELAVLEDTSALVETYLRCGKDASVASAFSTAAEIVTKLRPVPRVSEQSNAFWHVRLRGQDLAISRTPRPPQPLGILYDIDGDLAVSYFALDRQLLRIGAST